MSISKEQKENILGENRNLGWASVPDHAPEFVRTFITEHRTAILEKRSMCPEYVATYKAGAEKRSFTTIGRRAVSFGKRIFKPSVIKHEETLEQQATRLSDEISFERGDKLPTLAVARTVSKRTGRSFEDVLAEGKNKIFHRSHGLEPQATGPLTADERLAFERAFNRAMNPQGV